MTVKVHIGCQSIYLRDWINLDVPHPFAGLASEYPLRVERNITDEFDYYGRKKDKTPETIIREGPESNEGDVCDVYGSWQQMPFDDETVDEILSRQCFEHLSRPETMDALAETRRVLKPGGILRIDVPDHDETLEQLELAIIEREEAHGFGDTEAAKKQNDFVLLMKRHLLGSRKNDWAIHMGSWSREALKEFCGRYGFDFVEEEPNIHFYPAFSLKFRKGVLPKDAPVTDAPILLRKAAWEYVKIRLPNEDPDETCMVLDVGPGMNPYPLADWYVDNDRNNVARLKAVGLVCFETSVENLPAEWTGKFDYALASHVLEHVENPERAAAELSRVAKAGCVICPHPMKEGLFTAHERDHKWWVIGGKDCLYFHKIPWVGEGDARPEHLYTHIYDEAVAGQQHRLWRYGDQRLEGMSRKMREWWYRVEPMMDVVYHWKGTLNIKVCK